MDHVGLGGGDRHLGSDRTRALRHAGPDVHARERHAHGALGHHLLVAHQERPAGAAARARESAEHGQAGLVRGDLVEHRLGRERVRVDEQEGGLDRLEVRHAGDRQRVARLERLEVERLELCVRQRGRPHRHAALLDLAARAHHALSAAAHERARRQALVHVREASLGVLQVGGAGEHEDEVRGRAAKR